MDRHARSAVRDAGGTEDVRRNEERMNDRGAAGAEWRNATPPRSASRSGLVRHAALIAILAGAALCFAGIFQHGLWVPDEPREAEIGREMLASRWSAVPTLGGTPFLEKPPLFVWIMAAAYHVFGVSAGVARLPGALFSLGAIAVAYAMGRRAGGRVAGVAAAIVLATLVEFAQWSHRSVNDTALTFFVAAGHWALLIARDEHRLGRRSSAIVAAGACAGLAFLTKGFIGPVLLAGPPILAAVAMREWAFVRHALGRAAFWCTLFVVGLGLPWVLAMAGTAGWGAVKECLWTNTIGRGLGATLRDVGFGTHANPPWYYVTGFTQGVLPWALAIPALVTAGTLGRDWRAGRNRYLALLVLMGVLLLSIPAGKRPLYAVPLFPAAAVVLGTWLSRAGSRRGGRFDRATLRTMLGAVAATAALAAYVGFAGPLPHGSTRDKIDSLLAYHDLLAPAAAGVCAAVAACVAWTAVRAGRRPAEAAAFAVAATIVAGCFLIHVAGRPLIDRPLNNLEDGAVAVARAVPDGEEIFALAPDEVTRGVIPFYTGRYLRCIDRTRPAPHAPPWRYLVVMASSEKFIDAETRTHLKVVQSLTLTRDRALRVYRYDAE